MSSTEPGAPDAGTIPHCYRHPDRETYISCQRCGRPICPDCMRQASVGFQCPECVKAGSATMPQVRTSLGGRMRGPQPVITYLLIAINVFVFVVANAAGGNNSEFVYKTALIPSADVPQIGLEGVAQGSYWQLVTSMFLHVDPLHLILNMLALWFFGSVLEAQLGRWRYLVVYLLAGFGGSVMVYWFADPFSSTRGASGAVLGVLGASLAIAMIRGHDTSWLVQNAIFALVFTFLVPGISWQGHLGGFVTGLLLGAGLAWGPRKNRLAYQIGLFVLVFAVLVVLAMARTADLTS
jgi:membrane associated rhomboid family serine protease